MLMSRIVYVCAVGLLLALNGAALLLMSYTDPMARSVVIAALVVNMATWPLALIVAYRVGQATGVLKLKAKRR